MHLDIIAYLNFVTNSAILKHCLFTHALAQVHVVIRLLNLIHGRLLHLHHFSGGLRLLLDNFTSVLYCLHQLHAREVICVILVLSARGLHGRNLFV